MNPAESTAPETTHTARAAFEEPMHSVQIAGFRRMSVARNIEIITMMRETGIGLRIAGLRMRHPDWSEEKLETTARRAAMDASTG